MLQVRMVGPTSCSPLSSLLVARTAKHIECRGGVAAGAGGGGVAALAALVNLGNRRGGITLGAGGIVDTP